MKSSGPSGPCELSRTLQNNTHDKTIKSIFSMQRVDREEVAIHRGEEKRYNVG